MAILSNHTVEFLNERINYTNKCILEHASPDFQKMLANDLERYNAMKVEAENRIQIGWDMKDESMVYLKDGVIYVEGKPSGWSKENFELTNDAEIKVCYDGGSNWMGTLKISM